MKTLEDKDRNSNSTVHPRVLVVEDEPVIRELIVEALKRAGYQAEEASTADSAAKLMEDDGYQLLVTDVHMPGKLDGLDLAELARDHDPALPVVVVTGRPDMIERLRDLKVTGTLLPKPFKLAELVQVASRYVRASQS